MRVVVKIGTSSVTDDRGAIDDAAIAALAGEVAAARLAGHEVVVVSSGAVAAGVAALGLDSRPSDVATLQALAAAGQPRLMRSWDAALGSHGLVPAQALLVPHDFVDRRQYLHARRTLTRLLELGAVPIINENDAIASDETRYGDNDRIAALVAHNIGAGVLVLLTDLDGLYTADPRVAPDAELVTRVRTDDPLLSIRAGRGGSGRGSGGMASKLEAARIASWSGVRTVIAHAGRDGVLAGAIADAPVGTTFEAHRRKLAARKLWIAFAAHVAGTVTVDDGARRALVERQTSLLPAGVVDVTGRFGEGDTVDVTGTDGVAFARGMVFVEAAQLRRVAGRHTSDLPPGMAHEVIHRDSLVLLPA
ncbi:MAG TPA: glutamate 5-kinase [Ilumatobacteraceae bacterium]|nr:glutamate 5-kinase [Ilumatobacteraceae bacterium]